ncbi:probable receptor-like protein kinase At1g11050 [Andrographis paniculata]|uniref:probable receptor-like protein kinase At1g11050 n=1 Tax=Andrographis paniculata TaxID=175694 RepID=UPI0021E82579|nr:probable receptor-like protein kinase At1g11050 [Andrographis paniculata]
MAISKTLIFLFFFHRSTENEFSDPNPPCPIDFAYVSSFAWPTALCLAPPQRSCCQTLRSLFGMGLADRLRRTSQFYLPDAATSSSCLAGFCHKLAAISTPAAAVFPTCFNDTAEFAGILSHTDCHRRVPKSIPIKSSCNGDLSGQASYAAAIADDFGPQDVRSAACILGLPVVNKPSGGTTTYKRRLIFSLTFSSLASIQTILILLLIYRHCKEKRNAVTGDHLQNERL